jgi:hypothetical protein
MHLLHQSVVRSLPTGAQRVPPPSAAMPLRPGPLPAGGFALHYLEMVAAMAFGMFVLGSVFHGLLPLPHGTAVMLVEMSLAMTVPMVAWMRIRGHAWRLCTEMAAAMLVATAAMLGVLWGGLATDGGTLMLLLHAVMLPGMLAAMLLRRDEYGGRRHHHHRHTPVAV